MLVDVAEARGRAGHLAARLVHLRDLLEALADEHVDPLEAAADAVLGEVEHHLLGAVDELGRLAGAVPAEPLDLLADDREPAQRRHLAHDLRVVAGVRRRRHERRDLVDPRLAADLVELAVLVELVGDGDRVDRLAVLVELERGAVDLRVRLAVEVARVDDVARRPRSPTPRASSRRAPTPRRRGSAGAEVRSRSAARRAPGRIGLGRQDRVVKPVAGTAATVWKGGQSWGEESLCRHYRTYVRSCGRTDRWTKSPLDAGTSRRNPQDCEPLWKRSCEQAFHSCGKRRTARGLRPAGRFDRWTPRRRGARVRRCRGDSKRSRRSVPGVAVGRSAAGLRPRRGSASARRPARPRPRRHLAAAASGSPRRRLVGLGRRPRPPPRRASAASAPPRPRRPPPPRPPRRPPQLLLGRQLAALGDDQQAQLGGHVGEDLDRHRVAADALDRLHVELAAVDADLLVLPEPVGDVRRGDRAEERAGRAGVDVEAQLRRLEPLRDRAAPRRSSCASWRARCASRRSSSRTSPGVATSASPRGSR